MALSAATLRDALRGRRLNEGAARVLTKLENRSGASGLRRTYIRAGRSVTMWDLVSDEELSRSGYTSTRQSCVVASEDEVKRDRITYWISEAEAQELWVGEALGP